MHRDELRARLRRPSTVPLAAAILAVVLAGCSDALTDPRLAPDGGPNGITNLTLDGIEVTACQYGGFYPDCKAPPPSGGTVMPTSPTAPSLPGSGGGTWGSSGTPTPPDTTKRLACNFTGDSLIDNADVQAGLRQAWVNSNPSAPSTFDRREQGGWIVANGWAGHNTISFVPYTNVTSTPCQITPAGDFWDFPSGLILASVHTHTGSFGEVMDACRYRDPATGFMVTPIYRDEVSGPDYAGLAEMNRRLAAQGRPAIHAYVIDQDGIRGYNAMPGQTATYAVPIQRCGY